MLTVSSGWGGAATAVVADSATGGVGADVTSALDSTFEEAYENGNQQAKSNV